MELNPVLSVCSFLQQTGAWSPSNSFQQRDSLECGMDGVKGIGDTNV